MMFDCAFILFFNITLSNIRSESSDYFLKCSLSIASSDYQNITLGGSKSSKISFIETFSSSVIIANTSFSSINVLLVTHMTSTVINNTNFFDVNKLIFQTNSSIQMENCSFKPTNKNQLQGPVKIFMFFYFFLLF